MLRSRVRVNFFESAIFSTLVNDISTILQPLKSFTIVMIYIFSTPNSICNLNKDNGRKFLDGFFCTF